MAFCVSEFYHLSIIDGVLLPTFLRFIVQCQFAASIVTDDFNMGPTFVNM